MTLDQLKSQLLLYTITEGKPIKHLLLCAPCAVEFEAEKTLKYRILVRMPTFDQFDSVSNEIVCQTEMCVVDMTLRNQMVRRITRIGVIESETIRWTIADIVDAGGIIMLRRNFHFEEAVLKLWYDH